jgi:hypothetical protein
MITRKDYPEAVYDDFSFFFINLRNQFTNNFLTEYEL